MVGLSVDAVAIAQAACRCIFRPVFLCFVATTLACRLISLLLRDEPVQRSDLLLARRTDRCAVLRARRRHTRRVRRAARTTDDAIDSTGHDVTDIDNLRHAGDATDIAVVSTGHDAT